MGVCIGVDFHARAQTVCWCDPADGEIRQQTLDHQQDDVRGFYAQFATPAVVGIESSGYAIWFHHLVEETGHRLLVGDAFAIRQFARRQQKNDRRDAELLLELLLHGDFPAVHVPCTSSRARANSIAMESCCHATFSFADNNLRKHRLPRRAWKG